MKLYNNIKFGCLDIGSCKPYRIIVRYFDPTQKTYRNNDRDRGCQPGVFSGDTVLDKKILNVEFVLIGSTRENTIEGMKYIESEIEPVYGKENYKTLSFRDSTGAIREGKAKVYNIEKEIFDCRIEYKVEFMMGGKCGESDCFIDKSDLNGIIGVQQGIINPDIYPPNIYNGRIPKVKSSRESAYFFDTLYNGNADFINNFTYLNNFSYFDYNGHSCCEMSFFISNFEQTHNDVIGPINVYIFGADGSCSTFSIGLIPPGTITSDTTWGLYYVNGKLRYYENFNFLAFSIYDVYDQDFMDLILGDYEDWTHRIVFKETDTMKICNLECKKNEIGANHQYALGFEANFAGSAGSGDSYPLGISFICAKTLC